MRQETPQILRPWGGYTILKKKKNCWIKKLFINKNARLSLQSHQHRAEIWFILSGEIIAIIGNKQRQCKAADFVFVPKACKHRIYGIKKSCIVEIAFGTVLERDIIRYEDDYERV